MTHRPGLSDAERDVLRVLWDHGPATVRQINQILVNHGRNWAYTTVATLLQRLAVKQYVTSDPSTISHVFRALVSRDELLERRLQMRPKNSAMVIQHLLVLALVQSNRFSADELARLRCLLDKAVGHTPIAAKIRNLVIDRLTIRSRLRRNPNYLGVTPMLGWLTETTVIALGLASAAIVVSHLRSVGPTTRHALWLVVMIKLVTPPLLSWPWAISLPISNWFVSSTLKELEPHEVPVITTMWTDQSKLGVKPMVVASTLNPADDLTHRVFGDLMSEPSGMWVAWSEAPPAVLQRGWVKYRGLSKRSQLAWSAGSAWLFGSLFLAVGQAIRIVRFRRRLCAAVPAPDQLVSELERIGDRLDTRAPEILVLAELSTPMLWCWGRSRLLLPARLVKSLPLDRWRGVLTHELAHLRRGDQWVSRLELVAGLIWWWNPIYWLACARISAEAELACDAWVVWALPKDRVAYAEVLFDVCTLLSLSPSRPAAPALGIAGSGRFFERRLTLILHDHVPRRPSPLGLFDSLSAASICCAFMV